MAQKQKGKDQDEDLKAAETLAQDVESDSESEEEEEAVLDPENWVIVPPSECEGKEKVPSGEKSRTAARPKDEGDDFQKIDAGDLQP